MVHRDIKPSNIILTRKGDPVLTDYGIARVAGATSYTMPGTVVGSAQYMSPEQAQGQLADNRSDIYSLGICLFEALTGRVPFDGETTATILAQHLTAPVPAARALNPDLSPRGGGLLTGCSPRTRPRATRRPRSWRVTSDAALRPIGPQRRHRHRERRSAPASRGPRRGGERRWTTAGCICPRRLRSHQALRRTSRPVRPPRRRELPFRPGRLSPRARRPCLSRPPR